MYDTLVDLIISRKDETEKGITFILGDTEERFVSYKELYYTSASILYNLQSAGFRQKDEVIFQIDDNQKFIYAFWACVLGGMIPVPVTTGTNDEHKLKFFKIWNILSNPRMIGNADFVTKLETFAVKNDLTEKMNNIKDRTVFLEDLAISDKFGQISYAKPEDIAFIQFSSGSTGDPKGVIITHKNVIINLSSVIRWAGIDSNDAGLNWMPLTHDMGLIGTHIKDILACINQYNIQTQLFIRHPSLWMQKASEHKVTLLYSPNFGYKHFLKFYQPDSDKDWDLSNIRLIYNGAEPISVDLCDEFIDKMARYGLRRTAMHPVYGLAEGTIAVTFPNPGEDIRALTLNRDYLGIGDTVRECVKEDIKGCTFIDVGYPIYNCYMRICDEQNNDLGENRVGYIQIRGGNVTSGYYNNTEATQKTITSDGWLITGDLGFMREGRLVITGRAKDVIFITGQNYYSHDIERIAESIDCMELGKVAAVGVFNDKLKYDQLVMFLMFKQKVENFIPLVKDLKKVISEKLGIEVSEVIPVKNIPKTTSGKVQRYKLRESYINGEYDAVMHEIHEVLSIESKNRNIDLPENEIEEKLLKIWTQILNINKIGTRDNFFELGGDSLKATQLISRIQDELSVQISQAELFNNPELSELSKLIVSKAEKYSPEISIVVQNNTEELPLSFAQKRLWFIDRLKGSSPQYNLHSLLLLKGSLNYNALIQSFNQIINRHEILKVSFAEKDGEPVQLLNNFEISIPVIDLKENPEGMKKALSIAAEEIKKPFDLTASPLIKVKLFNISQNENILFLLVHHIIFDGWSFGVLLNELISFYEYYDNGLKYKLPDLKIKYSDFSEWQKNRQGQADFLKQVDYWKNKLSGDLPALDLPLDKQRPVIQTYEGAKFTSYISPEIAKKVRLIAANEGTTLYMILLAVFNTMLFKYTGQNDIIIGSPIANRNRSDFESLIGYFTNNLVLRTTFEDNTTFHELLQNVKTTTLEAYSNQDVPFERLVEELNIERDMSRNPLFQVLFSLQNTPTSSMEFSALNMSSINIDGGHSRFDLSVDIFEAGEGLEVNFEYNSDLFYPKTIERMAGHYNQLLKEIDGKLDKALESVDILTPNERKMLIETWNKTEADFNAASFWIDLFDAQVSKTPDAIAVVCQGISITYKELKDKADKLSEYLVSNGVVSETIIGVYLDRTIDMVISLLGIHKAGAAYLPMDPVFPKDRLEYMIENSGARIIITDGKLIGTLPHNNAKIICTGDLRTFFASFNEFKSDKTNISPKSLAYVIYTSGSTGKPKGVQIEQHSLKNFLMSMLHNTGISQKDSLLAVTTLSFDIAGLELFLPLITGAKLVIAARNELTDGQSLSALLSDSDITFMQATPATWRLLLDSGWKGSGKLNALCGGEALPEELASQLVDKCQCLWNVYGPTETTIWSTITKVEKNMPVSIGKPIANTQVYILDNMLKPVPIGVPGELYIGGDGLARGYLGQPELTSEKFIQNPFIEENNARIYRTGDLAKYMPDGNIEYVGRKDNQVKIRGFRIELGEIETLLNQNTLIREAVVVAKELNNGQKSLIAYIIPKRPDEEEDIPKQLREYLRGKLPEYMIPSYFIMMGTFPMTPNGKIDRRSMPLPQKSHQASKLNNQGPQNNTEKEIAKIWQEVLGTDTVGINDNFFDLGGHSLLLTKVRSCIYEKIGKDIPIMELFNYPTVNSLAKYVDSENEDKTQPKALNITREHDDIAVIGLSARLPGASDINKFWDNLCNGVESITNFSDEEIIKEGVEPELLNNPHYVKAWGVLEDVDKFDAKFFGYNPREANILDPQQRIFLEEAWKALEISGYVPEKFNGLIGIYASVGMNTYTQSMPDSSGPKNVANSYQIMINNDKDFLATRVAYKLNLEGPGITVQTACSSSLVAVHLACRSLMDRECDIALAGGVSVRLPQKTGYIYQEGMILSPDGHCRAFDENAKGTVGGNGAGVVVLKRLKDAIMDGDTIDAVIKGSAINNDGAMKIGYTAPRVEGQAKVIKEAYLRAGVSPETITYIETHGTGTPLGDPIEVEALKQAFDEIQSRQFCAIGSVKTNVGHLDSAAGVTGLIKTVLALKNKTIPPSLNHTKPNHKIDFENSPFFVNTSIRNWKEYNNSTLRAGVSSFGIGGTNAHLVLEEAPAVEKQHIKQKKHLIVLSAKTDTALKSMAENLSHFLKENPEIKMGNVAYTLQVGRKEFEKRFAFICKTCEEAIQILESEIPINDKSTSEIFDQNILNEYTLEQIAHFWVAGEKIDWYKLNEGLSKKRIPLPTYPFERQTYWVPKNEQKVSIIKQEKESVRNKLEDWFYYPVWKQSVNIPYYQASEDIKKTCLVLMTDNDFSKKFAGTLKETGSDVIMVFAGPTYSRISKNAYVINPDEQSDYGLLFSELDKSGKIPDIIVNHLGIYNSPLSVDNGKRIFYSMVFIAQNIGKRNWNKPINIKVFTNNMYRIFGEQDLSPEKALALGPSKVIPREYPNVKSACIDFILSETVGSNGTNLMNMLISEIYSEESDSIVAYRGNERWIQDFDKTELSTKNKPAISLKKGGVYLITGGLGGIGLTLAEYLAHDFQAKLVLTSRSQFPDLELWDKWLENHELNDSTSIKIHQLKNLLSLGSELLIIQMDVTDISQVTEARKQAEEKFGRVDGLIHAAGNPGGGMIQMKSIDFAERVLKPKVNGTINLCSVFKEIAPDFFIFCSSLNALTGGFGQVDYSSANAFMDAYAVANDHQGRTRFVSIDWDRWPGIGMAKDNGISLNSQKASNTMVGRKIYDNPEKAVYLTVLCPEKDWVLSEHLVLGMPTIAGTTYLEFARAAYTQHTGKTRPVISDVTFLTPLVVKPGEEREVMTVLNQNASEYEFTVVSRIVSENQYQTGWMKHVHGKISENMNSENNKIDLENLISSCNEQLINPSIDSEAISEEFIRFGKRWRTLKCLYIGKNEGVVKAELDNQFTDELNIYQLHPALLDVVTGSVRLAFKGNYLPFSYEKLIVKRPLSNKIYGHISFKNDYSILNEIISCDIDIYDDAGIELVKITNFSMRLVSETGAESIKERSSNVRSIPESSLFDSLYDQYSDNKNILSQGITPEEGIETFKHVVKGCHRSQIVISTINIDSAIEQAGYINQKDNLKLLKNSEKPLDLHPRPDLSNEFVAPKNDKENVLAEIWRGLLGIDEIGIHDEFFELGGDSLLLVQLHSKIKEAFTTELAVVDLYKYNTVSLLAKYLDTENVHEDKTNFDSVNSRVSKQLEMMKRKKQQMLSQNQKNGIA